ncbi:hypothetical protein HYR99_03375 [Candidatus Poribacteria bacterium]|nr:hypothetical protein [Candidatus Poribacteria bacterium]
MDKKRFDQAFEHFIEKGDEKITPKTFFEVLADIEKERAQRTVELQAVIGKDKELKFLPTEDISVHDNQIILGNQRILIKIVEGV